MKEVSQDRGGSCYLMRGCQQNPSIKCHQMMCKYLEDKTRLHYPLFADCSFAKKKDSHNSSHSVPSERFITKCIQIDDSQGMLRLWVGGGICECGRARSVTARAEARPVLTPSPASGGRSLVRETEDTRRSRALDCTSWGGFCSPTTRPLNHHYLPRRRRSVLLYTPCNQIFFSFRLMIRKTARGSLTDAIS